MGMDYLFFRLSAGKVAVKVPLQRCCRGEDQQN